MAVNEVMLGAGLATGMFYHAPEGTDLPASPEASLTGWTKVGDVTEEGITWGASRDFTPLKNWAGKIKRQLPGTDPQTIKVPIMDTTEEVFKTIFGASKVTVSGAYVTVDTSTLEARCRGIPFCDEGRRQALNVRYQVRIHLRPG